MKPIPSSRVPGILFVVAVLALPAAGCAGDAPNGGFGAGFELRPQANDSDVGLPIYPGAVRRIDKDDDSHGLTFSAWGGAWGFKIAALKLTSAAPIDQVAGYYRDALGRLGNILDCSPPQTQPRKRRDDGQLGCDDDGPTGNARVYKVGVPQHQRVVSLKAQGDHVDIDLVRVDAGQ